MSEHDPQNGPEQQETIRITREEAGRIGDVLEVTLRALQVLSEHPQIPSDVRQSVGEIAVNMARGVQYANHVLELDRPPVH